MVPEHLTAAFLHENPPFGSVVVVHHDFTTASADVSQKIWESTTLQVPRKLLSGAGALVVVAAIFGAGFFA